MANKDWKVAAIRRCEARLADLGGLGDGDDSLRLARATEAAQGLASVLGVAGEHAVVNAAGLAALLGVIADEMERCTERAMLDQARAA